MGVGKLIRCWGFGGWMLLVGLVSGMEAHTLSSAATLQLQWEKRLAGEVRNVTFSSDGRYLAATTAQGIALLEASGRLLWETAYSSISPWMRPPYISESIAVAPQGQWVAVTGSDPGYRYIWMLDKRGRKQWYVKTRGTPQALASTRKGDGLAIGTGGGHVYLVNPHGKVFTDVKLGGVVFGLSFSDDDATLLTTSGQGRVALLHRRGKVVWKREGVSMTVAASRDRHWFIVTDNWYLGVAAMLGRLHKPFDTVTLISGDGKEVWQKRGVEDMEALIAPDGSYVVVGGALPSAKESSPPTEEEEFERRVFLPGKIPPQESSPPTEEGEYVVLVLDRRGHVLAEWQDPNVGQLLSISRDARHIVTYSQARSRTESNRWVCRDRAGRMLQYLERAWSTQLEVLAPDLGSLVVARDDILRVYRLSEDWPCRRDTATMPQKKG